MPLPMNVEPIRDPDPEAMLRHLRHLVGGDLGDVRNGMIELAWTDHQRGMLSCARMFGIDEIAAIAERAAALNSTPGCNVYVGAALRRPDAHRERRGSDGDFFAAPCAWIDIDDDEVHAAVAAAKRLGVPPTMTVVTGRHPHLRAQMWWRLAEPCRDAAAIRALNAMLARALGGDPSVVNPGRVLRLGGSVAWPTKEGRVLERTETHVPQDGRPAAYSIARLAEAFGAGPDLLSTTERSLLTTERKNSAVASEPSEREQIIENKRKPEIAPEIAPENGISGLAIGSLSVDATIAAIRAGRRWHDNVVRLVAHWVARGWSDAEILATADCLTLPGWTSEETRRDIARMVDGARRKWNIPNPTHAIEDEEPRPPLEIDWVDRLNAAMIPRRHWLIGAFAVRGHVTVLVAPPGAGKSTFALEVAVAAATGRSEIIGETVAEHVRAWLWNNEDDRDELHRRLAAILQHWDIPFEEIRGRLALNSGVGRPLVVARTGRDGNVIRLPDFDQLAQCIKESRIDLLIVDPFVETHEVNENDNAHIKTVATYWREIAHRMNCAVVLVHHSGKPPAAAPDAWVGSMSASRGASALAGVARIMRTLFGMSERDATQYAIPDEERYRWVRLDDAKANLALASPKAKWFRRTSVTIANGDEVGVLVPDEPAPSRDAYASANPQIESEVLAEIDRAWRVGEPYSTSSRSPRFFERLIPRRLGRPAGAIAAAVEALLRRGAIEEAEFDSRNHRKGLRCAPPDRRGAPDEDEAE